MRCLEGCWGAIDLTGARFDLTGERLTSLESDLTSEVEWGRERHREVQLSSRGAVKLRGQMTVKRVKLRHRRDFTSEVKWWCKG